MFIKRLLIFLSSLGISVLLINPMNKSVSAPTQIPKPTPAAVQQYSCPQTEWIDCMPVIDSPKKDNCDSQYLDWVTKNCPNFEGVAF